MPVDLKPMLQTVNVASRKRWTKIAKGMQNQPTKADAKRMADAKTAVTDTMGHHFSSDDFHVVDTPGVDLVRDSPREKPHGAWVTVRVWVYIDEGE